MLLGNYWQVTGITEIGREYQTDFLKDSTHGLEGCQTWLLNIIPDNESILDIGLGPGHVYEIFRRAGRKNSYLGIDTNPENLEFAKKLFPEIQVQQEDCYFLPWEDNSFDNSILFDVLDSLPDFRKGLDEAIRVTKNKIVIAFDKNYTLSNVADRNYIGIGFPADYVVRINKDKFINYVKGFDYLIESGTIKDPKLGTDEYDYWIINKI